MDIATIGSMAGARDCKLKRVHPSKYVWMVKGKHQAYIHPDEVDMHLERGYEVTEKVKGTGKRNIVAPQDGIESGFWAGKHKGQTIYVLGCGTSLTPEMGQKLMDSKAITIGVNDIFRLCDPVFAPTYHIHVDYDEKKPEIQFSTINREGLEAMAAKGTQLLTPLNHSMVPTTDLGHQDYYSDKDVGFAAGYDVAGGDLRLGHSSSSIYQAIQAAVILGANPIFLLGVDYYIPKKGSGYGKEHFYDEYHDLKKKKQKKYKPAKDKELAFLCEVLDHDLAKWALPILKEQGVLVLNGSKKTRLKAFKYLDVGSFL